MRLRFHQTLSLLDGSVQPEELIRASRVIVIGSVRVRYACATAAAYEAADI